MGAASVLAQINFKVKKWNGKSYFGQQKKPKCWANGLSILGNWFRLAGTKSCSHTLLLASHMARVANALFSCAPPRKVTATVFFSETDVATIIQSFVTFSWTHPYVVALKIVWPGHNVSSCSLRNSAIGNSAISFLSHETFGGSPHPHSVRQWKESKENQEHSG